MTAGILVRLNLVQTVVLFPPVEIEILTDIRQRFLQRVGPDAEIGIRQTQSDGVDIILKAHIPAVADGRHDVVETAGVLSAVVILSV